jgi:hypothetical protein
MQETPEGWKMSHVRIDGCDAMPAADTYVRIVGTVVEA